MSKTPSKKKRKPNQPKIAKCPACDHVFSYKPQHGTVARYNWLEAPCRCVKCRSAVAAYQASRRREL